MFDLEVIQVSEIPEWRKSHPGNVSVNVLHSDVIARFTFEAKDPKEVTQRDMFGYYDSFGNFSFYDRNGTQHYVSKYGAQQRMHYLQQLKEKPHQKTTM